MAGEDFNKEKFQQNILSEEQEEILDLYIANLDTFLESIKESERLQAHIETLHLKRILAK